MTSAQNLALLSAFSSEFSTMIGQVETLSDLVRDHARLTAPADRSRVLTQAQGVDALSQRLHALRGLASALANEQPVDAALDAVPLADLAESLRRAILNSDPELASATAGAGDLMLFD